MFQPDMFGYHRVAIQWNGSHYTPITVFLKYNLMFLDAITLCLKSTIVLDFDPAPDGGSLKLRYPQDDHELVLNPMLTWGSTMSRDPEMVPISL